MPPAARSFPLRLPPGWWVHGRRGPYLVACAPDGRPRPALFYASCAQPPAGAATQPAGAGHLTDALCGELLAREPDTLILDRSTVTCRSGRSGVRVLSTCRTSGHSLTYEHWLLREGQVVLVAVVPTGRYAALASELHRAMRSFRG